MAHLLIIDDDPDLLPRKVPQFFRPLHTGSRSLRPERRASSESLSRSTGRNSSGSTPSRSVGPGRLEADPPNRRPHPGRLCHPGPVGRCGHRGDAARGLRLPAQAARLAKAGPRARRGVEGRPADARTGRCRGDAAGRRSAGRSHRRLLPGHAGSVQGHRPRRRPDFPVLITGESGTGKELVARADLPARPEGQGPVPGPQLCGHPGAAAGERTVRPREGRLHRRRPSPHRQVRAVPRRHDFSRRDRRHAAGTQAKILRLLQEQAFERVGGNETIRTDVRLIAATHRDLKAWSAEGKFRPDLYYRARRVHHPFAAVAGAGRRPDTARAALSCDATTGNSAVRFARLPRRHSSASKLRLARKHPGTAECSEAGIAARHRHGLAD